MTKKISTIVDKTAHGLTIYVNMTKKISTIVDDFSHNTNPRGQYD